MAKKLEKETQNLITFLQSNHFNFNAFKTEIIVFKTTKRTTNTHMFVDNVLIYEKEAIKYLGVHTDRLLTFQETQNTY